MSSLPSPHGDKLKALACNEKLPPQDQPRVNEAIERYEGWLQELRDIRGTYSEIVTQMVSLLNTYKTYIEVHLIFDSEQDFLYRQKGQLKLDNTIIEEFLPTLVTAALRKQLQDRELSFGPTTCFSSIRFESSIASPQPGGGMQLRQKNHDFAIAKRLFIQTSHQPDFQEKLTAETHIAYVAAECKTNLDKTMFQEAAATALDVKTAVPAARYYLLCEWLDMTPINTSTTAIDEIIVLRKAKRLPSNVRAAFNTASGRQTNRTAYVDHLASHPLSSEAFSRFLDHVRRMINEDKEENVLSRGYF